MKAEGNIYIKNKIAGRSIYSKLHDVLDLNDKPNLNDTKYTYLGKPNKIDFLDQEKPKESGIIKSYKNFNKSTFGSSNLDTKYNTNYNKTGYYPYSTSKFTNNNNSNNNRVNIYNTIYNTGYDKALFLETASSNKNRRKMNGKFIVSNSTTEHILLNSFKKAVKANRSDICKSEKFILELNRNVIINSQDRRETHFEFFADKVNEKLNKSRLVFKNTNPSSFSKNYSKNNILLSNNHSNAHLPHAIEGVVRTKSTFNADSPSREKKSNTDVYIKEGDCEKNNNHSIFASKKTTKNISNANVTSLTNTSSHHNIYKTGKIIRSTNFKSKLKNFLYSAINYLHINNISIEDFHENNILSNYPFSRQKSYDFFEKIKNNDIEKALYLIKQDRVLLFDHDYFGQTCYHWAAKRNYSDLLKALINCGKHINLLDNNSRSPLFLAAQNNHYESVKVLIENDASPFQKNQHGISPIDACTEIRVKKIIEEGEKKNGYMKAEDYIKKKILSHYSNQLQKLIIKRKSRNIEEEDFKRKKTKQFVSNIEKYDFNVFNNVIVEDNIV